VIGSTPGRRTIADIGVLLLVIVPLGVVLVPAHWTSIWMDREFQGWMIAVANRLADGPPLYADGTHSPMPPLPFVIELLAGGGKGTWLTESALNFTFQALMLFGMYATLRACARPPIPLCATLAATPIIFAIHKVALHDSVAQCCAAWTTMAVVRGLAPGGAARARWWLVGAGLLNALCILSKQSTAAGLTLGIVMAYLIAPGPGPAGRVARAAAHVGWTLGFVAVLALALSPVLSVQGLLTDVFLFGAEPKGGPREAARNLVRFARQATPQLVVYGPVALGLTWLAARARRSGRVPSLPGEARSLALSSVLIAAVALLLALVAGRVDLGPWYRWLRWLGYHSGSHVPWTGLCLGLVGVAWGLRRASPREDAPWTAMVVILVPTALAHNLSTLYLRWTYDNNPIIVVAMAWIAREALGVLALLPARSRRVAQAALGVTMQLGAWLGLQPQLTTALQCTHTWPEVAHLRGARLRPSAEGMRRLVHLLRELNGPDDRILLLPEDPNVQAWLERPRPHLTSAIVFSDQYWDRYVDEDFRRLAADPPRTIVLGPRGYAPVFDRLFGNRRWGVERLTARIRAELLPGAYVLHTSHVIAFQGGTDWMDVYVRRPSP
jgi:hypothetical protein